MQNKLVSDHGVIAICDSLFLTVFIRSLLSVYCHTCPKLKTKACILLYNGLSSTFPKGIIKSWKTGMLNKWMKKHLNILSETTAIEYSNHRSKVCRSKGSHNIQTLKTNPLVQWNLVHFHKTGCVGKREHSRTTNIRLINEICVLKIEFCWKAEFIKFFRQWHLINTNSLQSKL